MDNISFANPNGFPLEADATLGAMQNNYVTSVKGLAAAFGGMTIVSGLEPNGSAVTDGWIYMGGDFVFFQGGAPDASFYIETTVVQKANENGVMYDRYFTKRAKFGTHSTLPNYTFGSLKRLHTQSLLQSAFLYTMLETEIILAGCQVSYDSSANTIDITEGLVYMAGKIITTPSLEAATPTQYLVVDTTLPNVGKYVSSLPSSPYIAFNSGGTSQYYKDVLKRQVSIPGEVRMIASTLSDFDNTGLGVNKMKGWAICNGSNGTFDMRGKTPVALAASGTFNTVGNSGGAEAITIGIANMPAHNHAADGSTGDVPATEFGLIRRSQVGESRTVSAADSLNSGTEPDIVTTPVRIPMQGSNEPISILQPYKVLLFIQRI